MKESKFENGLRVVNVSKPAVPFLAGFYDTAGQAVDVAIADGYIYVAVGYSGLVILQASYAISGSVIGADGNLIKDVNITATGGRTTETDDNGVYSIGNLAAGLYTLTASKAGYTFAPLSLQVTLPPDATGQNFMGTALTYSISGRVVEAGNTPIAGVIVSATGDFSVVTDAAGEYTFSGLSPGTSTLIPLKECYRFAPTSRTIGLPPNAIS